MLPFLIQRNQKEKNFKNTASENVWNNSFKACLTLKLTEEEKGIKVETLENSFQKIVLFKLQTTKYFQKKNGNI